MERQLRGFVVRETKHTRAQAARARRATLAAKLRDVTLLPISLPDGGVALLAVTAADPDRGYILRRDDEGAWRCGCFNARWSVARTCAHEAAANTAQEAEKP